jgi:hypothetical protein
MQILEVDRFERAIRVMNGSPRSGGFSRHLDIHGSPANVDAAITFARDRALPVLRAQSGFRAMMLGVNRETGRMMASSVWETAAEREASAGTLNEVRAELGRTGGADTVRVELYEGAYVSVKDPAPA